MIARLRLISGFVLTLYVVGHFINHALGIISIRAMNDALKYFIQPWREPVGATLLIASLLVHMVLAFHALYRRRTLKMSIAEALQYISGFLIPVLLAAHVLATRGLYEVFGVLEGYQFTLFGMWVPSKFYGILAVLALVVVWGHVCIGWHHWLRLKSWYQPLQPYVWAIAIILPTLALAGFASASLRVVRLSGSEKWVTRLFAKTHEHLSQFQDFILTGERAVWIAVAVLLFLVLAIRWGRNVWGKRSATIKVEYFEKGLRARKELSARPGTNLLDLFRSANIPHASICGGRGRCSTCRVRVDEGLEGLPAASAAEMKVLNRIDAPKDVRLACQTVPVKPLRVTALLDPETGLEAVNSKENSRKGEEQEVAILFADIRSFSKLAEARLPYDVAFLLNRYFAAMGKAIESAGGQVDKFIGDGVMALFGVDESLEEGCRKALLAANRMSQELAELNKALQIEIGSQLRIGIGIHCGTAIVGKMGYGKTVSLTAIGEVVNTASRLENLTKEYAVQLIVSEQTIEEAKADFSGFDLKEMEIRGTEGMLLARVVANASDIKL